MESKILSLSNQKDVEKLTTMLNEIREEKVFCIVTRSDMAQFIELQARILPQTSNF